MKVNNLNLNIHQVLMVSFNCTAGAFMVATLKKKKKRQRTVNSSQHSVCMTLAIQSDLATSNLSLSPDDWISSFPLTETKQR